MARIPILNPGQAQDASLKAMFEGIEQMGMEKFMNQIGTLANHPPIAKAIVALLKAYYFDSVVPRKYLEMAILLVSARNRCHYCVVHHSPPALEAGLSHAQLAAIDEGTWEAAGLFDETERTVLRYTQQLSARSGRVDDSTFTALRRLFTEQQVVELTVRAAMCEFFNRFNEAFQIDMEPVAEVLYRTAMDQPARKPVERRV